MCEQTEFTAITRFSSMI